MSLLLLSLWGLPCAQVYVPYAIHIETALFKNTCSLASVLSWWLSVVKLPCGVQFCGYVHFPCD